jgi:DNA-directed RNA polymerase subunit M/transcription elongation factor TFIIS
MTQVKEKTGKATNGARKQQGLTRLPNGVEKCPDCNVRLRVDQTKNRGHVVVVYYQCPICENRYRGDRDRDNDGMVRCPECNGWCKSHAQTRLANRHTNHVHCLHCGLNWNYPAEAGE